MGSTQLGRETEFFLASKQARKGREDVTQMDPQTDKLHQLVDPQPLFPSFPVHPLSDSWHSHREQRPRSISIISLGFQPHFPILPHNHPSLCVRQLFTCVISPGFASLS